MATTFTRMDESTADQWAVIGTEIALPMSWHRAATTTSSSAPDRSASVAVCRQWVS